MQILWLLAELSKSPEERNLPEGLLQGFEKLVWLDNDCILGNTLDYYFGSLGHAASHTTVQVQSGESDKEIDKEEIDNEKDVFIEAIGAIRDIRS